MVVGSKGWHVSYPPRAPLVVRAPFFVRASSSILLHNSDYMFSHLLHLIVFKILTYRGALSPIY